MKGGWRTQKLCLNKEQHYNKRKGSTRMCTTEDRWLHRFTKAGSTYTLTKVHEQTMQNARRCRPLQHTMAQVPHKTPLSMKELWHWWTHGHVCITIPQALEGTQPLFVANFVKLHLLITATLITTTTNIANFKHFDRIMIIIIIMAQPYWFTCCLRRTACCRLSSLS